MPFVGGNKASTAGGISMVVGWNGNVAVLFWLPKLCGQNRENEDESN